MIHSCVFLHLMIFLQKNKDMKFYSKDIYSANVPNLVEKLEKSEGFDFMGNLFRNWIVVHRYGDYVCVKDGRFKSELHIRIFENKKMGTYEIECMVHKVWLFVELFLLCLAILSFSMGDFGLIINGIILLFTVGVFHALPIFRKRTFDKQVQDILKEKPLWSESKWTLKYNLDDFYEKK